MTDTMWGERDQETLRHYDANECIESLIDEQHPTPFSDASERRTCAEIADKIRSARPYTGRYRPSPEKGNG